AELSPDVVSYSAAISSCEKGGSWPLALQLFDSMRQSELSPDVISYSAAISSCEKGMRWQLALQLFGSLSEEKLRPNVICYNATISSCEKGLVPDLISYSATISSCEKGAQWQLALELFDALPRAKLTPDVISYGAAIVSCEEGGQPEKAFILFCSMLSSHLQPHVMLFSGSVQVHGQLKAFDVKPVTEEEPPAAGKEELLLPTPTPRALTQVLQSLKKTLGAVEAFLRKKQARAACQLLHAVRLSGSVNLDPGSAFGYSVTISACEKGRNWEQAMLFEEMQGALIAPDVPSYSATISACQKAGQWQLALQLFGEMLGAKLTPDVISYSVARRKQKTELPLA
ncbi:unnamed protein product, partial [Symbiodinium sp. KB8]